MSTNMKSEASLWRGECAAKVVRHFVVTAAVVVVVALFIEHWAQVKSLLQLVLGAGGFWHSWGMFAGVSALAAYFACVANSEEVTNDTSARADLWRIVLSLIALVASALIPVFWWTEILVPGNCIRATPIGDLCDYSLKPLRAGACLALAIFSAVAFVPRGEEDKE